jgi:hypothetical protein
MGLASATVAPRIYEETVEYGERWNVAAVRTAFKVGERRMEAVTPLIQQLDRLNAFFPDVTSTAASSCYYQFSFTFQVVSM